MALAEYELSDLMGERRSIKMFFPLGVYPIGNFVQDGVLSLGSPNALSSVTANFTVDVVGLPITVDGAGVAGAVLKTTIASYISPTQVTLTVAASTAVTAAIVWYGTDCSSNINAAIAAISVAGGGALYFPFGYYFVSHPIIMKSNVSLYGEQGSGRYAFIGQSNILRSVIKTASNFPSGGSPVIDARIAGTVPVNSIGLYDLEIIGDGTSNQNQVDATTIGIAHGSATASVGSINSYGFIMERCSIILHKYGVWVQQTAIYHWRDTNIACNWYIGCNFDQYGGNDATYTGMMVNTNNTSIPGISSPLNDVYTGCGIRLNYGCGYQTWLGGKIEWNATGIVVDKGAFACRFTGVLFDANSKWHVRVIGSNDNINDPLFTFDNTFLNCRFNGGCYNASILAAGLDGHIFIDASYDQNNIAGIPVGLSIIGGSMKATPQFSVIDRLDVFPQYPQHNIISSRVTGSPFSGQGNPILILTMQGVNCQRGSVFSFAASCTAFTVTGSGFDTSGAWNGKVFWYFYYNQYTIANVGSGTSLTLTTSQTLVSETCAVETNKILISSNFSTYSDIRIQSCPGLTDSTTRPSSDLQNVTQIVNPANGNLVWQITANAVQALLQGQLAAYNLVLTRDESGLLWIGRQSSGTPVAVIDGNSPDGLNLPTSFSLRLQANEFLNYSSVTGKMTVTHALLLNALAGSGSQVLFVDNSGNVSIVSYGALTLLLSTFTPTAIGLVPGSGGGTANFLRADGSWVPPTIAGGSVTLADMANLPADTIIGNNTGSPATPLALTVAQVTALLALFTSSLQGLVPASGGGTTNFLRADGTWTAVTGVTSIDTMTGAITVTVTNSGVGGARLSGVASGGVEAFTLTQPGAWTAYTPSTGNLSSVTSTCRFQQIGKTVFIRIQVSGTVISTSPVTLTLPTGLTPFNSNELFLLFERSTTGGNDGTVPFLPLSGVTLESNVSRVSGLIVTYDYTGHYETS